MLFPSRFQCPELSRKVAPSAGEAEKCRLTAQEETENVGFNEWLADSLCCNTLDASRALATELEG